MDHALRTPTVDAANLAIFHPQHVFPAEHAGQNALDDTEAVLVAVKRCLTALSNAAQQCAQAHTENGTLLALPRAFTRLPREKPMPSASKMQTAWERFQQKKEIRKHRNQRNTVYDEAALATPASGAAIFVMVMRNPLELPKHGIEILAKYRLRKMYDGIVLGSSRGVARDMHILGDFVAVQSMESAEIVSILRQKGGYLNEASERRPLNSNAAIEKRLGHVGVICVDDIFAVIRRGASCEAFEEVVQFLEPVNLAPPMSADCERRRISSRVVVGWPQRVSVAYRHGRAARGPHGRPAVCVSALRRVSIGEVCGAR